MNSIYYLSRAFLFLFFLGMGTFLRAQHSDPNAYVPIRNLSGRSVANAHSHNDYEQSRPFSAAYEAKFGSMEADIWLSSDSLFVGHEEGDIQRHRMLRSLYLDSLAFYIVKNAGYPYADHQRRLQLLIDVKTVAGPTLKALLKVLNTYPSIVHCKGVSLVITGNRPPVETWKSYPSYIYFDGRFNETYPVSLRSKIGMISNALDDLIKWDGQGLISPADSAILATNIQQAHRQGKKVRFWGAPDFPNAWKQLMHADVDWINTDHISALADFLHNGQP